MFQNCCSSNWSSSHGFGCAHVGAVGGVGQQRHLAHGGARREDVHNLLAAVGQGLDDAQFAAEEDPEGVGCLALAGGKLAFREMHHPAVAEALNLLLWDGRENGDCAQARNHRVAHALLLGFHDLDVLVHSFI